MIADVAENYVHRNKYARPGEAIVVSNLHLKWANIASPEAPVPAGIEALARECAGNAEITGDLGFVILHRCGESFYFLLISTWRNENELWESVYAKRSAEDAGFSPFTFQSPHRGTFCVWELGVVWHEQQAWKRFLLSRRGPDDMSDYLNDSYEGPV